MTRHKSSPGPLRLPYGTDAYQFGELSLPTETGPFPVVILIHGGYWRSRFGLDLMNGLAKDLADRGIAAWNIEYRRVGNSGGGWPGTFLDVANATDYLTKMAVNHQLDLKRVIPIGHSAGGHLAFWLAARSHLPPTSVLAPREQPLALAGAISLAGVVDLNLAYQLHLSNNAVVELLGGTPEDVPERYAAANPADHLPLGIPQILIHGTSDSHVPLEVSRQYSKSATAVGDTFKYFEPAGVDHFDVITSSTEIWQLTLEELKHLL